MYLAAEYVEVGGLALPITLIVLAVIIAVGSIYFGVKYDEDLCVFLFFPVLMGLVVFVMLSGRSDNIKYNELVDTLNYSDVKITDDIPEGCKLIKINGKIIENEYYIVFECKTSETFGYSKEIEVKIPASLRDFPFYQMELYSIKREPSGSGKVKPSIPTVSPDDEVDADGQEVIT